MVSVTRASGERVINFNASGTVATTDSGPYSFGDGDPAFTIRITDDRGAKALGGLDQFGIVPRTVAGLRGILFAPFLHANFTHLIANTPSPFDRLSLVVVPPE